MLSRNKLFPTEHLKCNHISHFPGPMLFRCGRHVVVIIRVCQVKSRIQFPYRNFIEIAEIIRFKESSQKSHYQVVIAISPLKTQENITDEKVSTKP